MIYTSLLIKRELHLAESFIWSPLKKEQGPRKN